VVYGESRISNNYYEGLGSFMKSQMRYNHSDYLLLIYSFVALNLGNWLGWNDVRLGIPNIIKYVLFVFVLGVLIYYRLTKPSRTDRKGLVYFIIIFFVVWSAVLIFTSIIKLDSLKDIQRLLADRYFFIPYILPALILFTKFDFDFFRDMFKYSFIFLIPAILLQLYFIFFNLSPIKWYEQLEAISIFSTGASFLLLIAHISSKRYVSLASIGYYLLLILLFIAYGRRGGVMTSILFLFFMIILRLKSPFLKIYNRIRVYLTGLLLVLLVIIFGHLLSSTYAFQRGFNKNAFNESRGVVFEDFFYDFTTINDWLFGRGLEGKIRRSISIEGSSETIENGFLTILLRGGLFYLVPFIIILLRASFLGLHGSRNDLAKALGFIILIHLVGMFAFNLPDYSGQYILIWISVSACYSPELRNLRNAELYKTINSIQFFK